MYSLIMAGGIGKRFWPRSRRSKPKQLLDIVSSASMLRLTYDRLKNISEEKKIYAVANPGLKESILEELQEMPTSNYITEPCGKNTAPCIGLSAAIIAERDPDAVIGVFPADHLIRDTASFRRAVQTGYQVARDHDALVTFGIRPTRPATGYGYIQLNKKKPILDDTAFKVKTFAEKPNIDTAKRFIESGDFLWNSGIFIFRADVILDMIEEYLPNMHAGLMEIKRYMDRPNYAEVLDRVYHQIKSISIDYGIMEKAKNVYTVRGKFYWNDLGSWEQVYEISNKDKQRNVVSGGAVLVDVKDSYVSSSKGVVAVVGLDNVVVVQEGGATLVCARDHVEDVKKVVNQLKHKKLNKHL